MTLCRKPHDFKKIIFDICFTLVTTEVVQAVKVWINPNSEAYTLTRQEYKNMALCRFQKCIGALLSIETPIVISKPWFVIWLCCTIRRYFWSMVQSFLLLKLLGYNSYPYLIPTQSTILYGTLFADFIISLVTDIAFYLPKIVEYNQYLEYSKTRHPL